MRCTLLSCRLQSLCGSATSAAFSIVFQRIQKLICSQELNYLSRFIVYLSLLFISKTAMSPEEFELDKSTNSFAQIALFRNVQNTKELKTKLLSGQLECCMINPALILDPFQIIIAVNKAVNSESQKKLTTRNVFTEILYNLSASKNITQSLKRFGIDEDDRNLVVVAIRKNEISSLGRVLPLISGDLCPISEVYLLTDIALIKKTYNVKDDELKASPLLDSIVSRIAAKDIFTFKM